MYPYGMCVYTVQSVKKLRKSIAIISDCDIDFVSQLCYTLKIYTLM